MNILTLPDYDVSKFTYNCLVYVPDAGEYYLCVSPNEVDNVESNEYCFTLGYYAQYILYKSFDGIEWSVLSQGSSKNVKYGIKPNIPIEVYKNYELNDSVSDGDSESTTTPPSGSNDVQIDIVWDEDIKDMLASIQATNERNYEILYSQYEAQQNFHYATMALLGLIFGTIFIKGIFKR